MICVFRPTFMKINPRVVVVVVVEVVVDLSTYAGESLKDQKGQSAEW